MNKPGYFKRPLELTDLCNNYEFTVLRRGPNSAEPDIDIDDQVFAAELVRRWNAHQELITLLEALNQAMSQGPDGYWRIGPMADPGTDAGKGGKVEMLRSALAKERA